MLLYNHAANVTVRTLGSNLVVSNGVTFESTDEASLRAPVVSRTNPYVFFHLMVPKEEGLDWRAVQRGNLVTGDVETILTDYDLGSLASPNIEPPWVVQIIGVAEDGSSLTVVIGVPAPLTDGMKVQFAVYDIDVATKSLKKVMPLMSPFG